MDVRASDGPSQYLSFFIDGEEYAIGILQVKEIIRYDTITKVPTTPRWIRGVLNLRGLVVPVVESRGEVRHPRDAGDGADLRRHRRDRPRRRARRSWASSPTP